MKENEMGPEAVAKAREEKHAKAVALRKAKAEEEAKKAAEEAAAAAEA